MNLTLLKVEFGMRYAKEDHLFLPASQSLVHFMWPLPIRNIPPATVEIMFVRFALGPTDIRPWNGVESLVGEFLQRNQGKAVM